MSKNHTLRNVIITAAVVGTAMHVANEFIMKYATSKDLLKKVK